MPALITETSMTQAICHPDYRAIIFRFEFITRLDHKSCFCALCEINNGSWLKGAYLSCVPYKLTESNIPVSMAYSSPDESIPPTIYRFPSKVATAAPRLG